MKEAVIQAGRHPMFYRYSNESQGPVVVFLHGIPTNSWLWSRVVPYLEGNCTVIVPDLVGFGRSGRAPAEELDLPRQAEHVLALLDQLGIAKAHFVGHDIGGGISQILAVRYPERVQSLVLTDCVCFSNWPLREVVAMRWPTAPEFEPSPAMVERLLRQGLYHQNLLTPDLLEQIVLQFAHPAGPEELQTIVSAMSHVQTEEIVPDLPNIRVPVTVIWGQHDRLLPPYWGSRLQQTIPNARLRVLPETGHFTMIDSPSLFAVEVLQHLQRSRSGSTQSM